MRLIRQIRWGRLLLLTLLLGTLLCAVQTFTEPQRYTGVASLRVVGDSMLLKLLEEHPTGVEEKTEAPAPAEVNRQRFEDLLQNTSEGGFVHSALRGADLKHPLPLVIADPSPRATGKGTKLNPRVKKLLGSIFVRTESSEVFSIHLTWEDKNECESLLEAFRDNFINECGRRQQVEAVAIRSYQISEIEQVRRQLQVSEDREASASGSGGAKTGDAVLQVEREALREQMHWTRYASALSVTAHGMLAPQNNIYAEPVVTPCRILSEAPGRLWRCTLLSFVLVLAGTALRQALLRRRQRYQEAA
ncbi:MAG: hypothetical protein V4671_19445 [Armatimonadota bacterium]